MLPKEKTKQQQKKQNNIQCWGYVKGIQDPMERTPNSHSYSNLLNKLKYINIILLM